MSNRGKHTGLAFAESLCEEKGLRFTPIRRQILELIWDSTPHIKAYDIQKKLEDMGEKLNPPTIYRALDFLLSNGMIHRIESLNAYAPCYDHEDYHHGQFIICNDCGNVTEIHEDSIINTLLNRVEGMGYSVQDQTIELRVNCRKKVCEHRPQKSS